MSFSNIHIPTPTGITGSAFTSPSCALVAGMMSLYYERFRGIFGRYPTPRIARDFMYANCTDIGQPGIDPLTGRGIFRLPDLNRKYTGEKSNPLAVKMIKPDGTIIYSHKDHIQGSLLKGYKVV